MALRTLTEDEWLKIAAESDEIGYCLTAPETVWKPERHQLKTTEEAADGYVRLPTGILSVAQLEHMMNHLPVDITFIDENDVVRYFSHGKERIFARTKAVIGRTVQNCHPPASVHIVNKLLDDFKSGKKTLKTFGSNLKTNTCSSAILPYAMKTAAISELWNSPRTSPRFKRLPGKREF